MKWRSSQPKRTRIGVFTIGISLKKKRLIIRVTTIIGIILALVGSYFIAKSSYFKPNGGFYVLLLKIGPWAPIIFICLQISQIIYPMIPFGLTNVIGNLVFGTGWGFLFNCIGMLIGSSINFYLGRRYGEHVIKAFISDEKFDEYVHKMNDSHAFEKLLAIGFILPVFPDDLFCMFSGMSNMTFKKFFRLVILYRPISLFVFTYAWAAIIQYIASFIH
ncbi:TVP38/TMEM64 family protein [Aerococcaceae bacterium zg-1292]|uniref:TVP38/TMEM64 family protein n=1 Tax=Aerococcaceae bacterium zg-1292 TaxID=2774330 RepID=UPI00385FC1F4